MDTNKETKVKDYIEQKENSEWNGELINTVADLVWLEKEAKDWILSERLKNNEGLLSYAKLVLKTENLNFWEKMKKWLLEVKLSITCPYFSDFKDFLEDLKRWSDTSITATPTTNSETTTETTETLNHTFFGTNINNIKSEPFQKNSKTWVTRCSKTARFNWKNFWINLPSWDAYKAWKNPWKDSISTIPSDKKNETPNKSRKWIHTSSFKSINKGNYADIYTNSKSGYWHRAAAFRDDNWQRYILDPYTRVNGILDNSPKKLEDYLKTRKIVKAHIYESKWYKTNNSIINEEWTWYERKNN